MPTFPSILLNSFRHFHFSPPLLPAPHLGHCAGSNSVPRIHVPAELQNGTLCGDRDVAVVPGLRPCWRRVGPKSSMMGVIFKQRNRPPEEGADTEAPCL